MTEALIMLLVTAVSGLLAGAGFGTFLAAALAAVSAAWLARIPRHPVQRLFATLDPQQPDAEILVQAIRKTLTLIRQNGRPVLLRIAAFMTTEHPVFRFELSRSGDLEVCRDGCRPQRLCQPAMWIADHPLPLSVPPARCLTLYVTPAGPRRVRASCFRVFPLPCTGWCVLALLILFGCLSDTGWILAAALGFTGQTYLMEQQAQRARD